MAADEQQRATPAQINAQVEEALMQLPVTHNMGKGI